MPNASETLIFINGEFIPESPAGVSPLDRGFLYGDALFETIRVKNGHAFLWESHLQRLELGARYLKIPLRFTEAAMQTAANKLLATTPNGFLRIQLSRGKGARGYSPRDADSPTLVISAHPANTALAERLKLMTASVRVMADEPWTQFKTANRLPNVLARREADETGVDEALLLNHRWTIAGASAANVFCVRGNSLRTPPLAAGGIAGTTRAFVMSAAREMGIDVIEEELTLEDFHGADAAFLTSAGLLVAGVENLDSKPKDPLHPTILRLRAKCEAVMEKE